MRWPWSRAVTLVNARVVTDEGLAGSMRFRRRVLDLDAPARHGDVVVDLEGAFVLPGLVNAHDHLELNHYGALRPRECYVNAVDWIDDLRIRLDADPQIRRNRSFPLADRLFIGGLKNLLSGVTLVAHHNPLYPGLVRQIPIRVLRRFGWAHSFALEGLPVGARGEPGPDVVRTFRAARRDVPFFVHAGEGVDARAADEIARLDASGCLRSPLVMVHAVALPAAVWRRAAGDGAGIVWCPASNRALLGCAAPVRAWLDESPDDASRICLGTDSRLTGARDLLDELRAARTLADVSAEQLLRMVTTAAGDTLRQPTAGRLRRGGPADFIVVPAAAETAAGALLAARRADLLCVAVAGRPLVLHPRLAALGDARASAMRAIAIDGLDRLIASRVVRRLEHCAIAEPGVATVGCSATRSAKPARGRWIPVGLSVEGRRRGMLLSDGDARFADAVAGKRVIVVGPARTLVGRGRGAEIDRWDVVVRFNEAAMHPFAPPDVHRDYGARTDICYGNQVILRSCVERAARDRFLAACRAGALRFVVCTNNSLSYRPDGAPSATCPPADRKVPSELASLLGAGLVDTRVRMAHAASDVLHRWLGGHWGRTGFIGIFDLLTLGVAALHVTGMTFYHGGGHLLAPEGAVLHPRRNRDGTTSAGADGRGHDSYLERDAMRWLMRGFPRVLSVDGELDTLLR